MNSIKQIICNESGHGQVPSAKEFLKIGLILITFPVSVPALVIRDKIKEKLEKRKNKK